MRDRGPSRGSPVGPATAPEAADQARWYDQAIAEFGPSLARLAAAYEFDRALQQDLLQEIHLALWRSFAGFRRQCSLRTWVYRVGHNTAATYVRRQKRAGVSRLVSLSAQTCAAHHQRHLERQRDIALSWPWGIGLAIPGFVLVVIGLGAGTRDPDWMFMAIMTGVFLFMYIAMVIYGKMLAQRWQREIEALRSLTQEPR